MPTYEFRCPAGHDFEKFYRSIAIAPAVVHCPTCGKISGRQMSAGGGLLFKGSGFYITDYGKDGKKPQTTATGSGESVGGKEKGEAAAVKTDSPGGADAGPASGAAPDAGKPKPAQESNAAKPPAAKKPKTDK